MITRLLLSCMWLAACGVCLLMTYDTSLHDDRVASAFFMVLAVFCVTIGLSVVGNEHDC